MQDLEGDMLRAVAALSGAVDFLHRYDRLQAALRIEAGASPSALTTTAEDGLAAAHRVLDTLRSPNGRPVRTEPFIPAQRTSRDRLGDPGE
ncbi:hypothetical protein Ais01nite_64160 [Asanoa ishikariensis]|uniref:Uncharacterized protein n=1 Tax=Asanoa ishikariensis TaxID=137265 RepID=A0A1H3NTH8_9ACTN|nr:hypothetical protein [Asanoa ishikariensis]GIF68381.1 hypothetical protein Ais01nite_64160 [Asanoa ishikariensis]SDY92000.1 hypothetical protein SAMN05421684_2307 [Asanoa ishikariensis]